MKPFAFATCLLSIAACGEEETPPQGPLAVTGTWADDFGQDHAVTEANWVITGFGETSVFNLVGYDNDVGTLIAQNATDNSFNPGLWSRFDWTTRDDELWYCQSVIDGGTEADARSPAAAADDHAPDTEGCAGYPWSRLRAPLTIRGDYTDNWGVTHAITQTAWTQTLSTDVSLFHITVFDNTVGFAVAENDAANAALPSRWSRFDWTENTAGLWFCRGTRDANDEAAALAAPVPDATNPATTGCSGNSWSRLTVAP